MGGVAWRSWGGVWDVCLGTKQQAATVEELDEQLAESCTYGHNLSWFEVHPNVIQTLTRKLGNDKCAEIQAATYEEGESKVFIPAQVRLPLR